MGIRRRRRQLTTLMNRMDQRVRSVELRPISLLTQAQISSLVSTGATATETSPTIVSSSAPNQWARVASAWLYPKKATGLKSDYVEVMFESDIGLAVSDSIQVSGIHYVSAGDIEVSGTFKVTGVDTAPWTSRPSYAHTPDTGITNTYTYSPGTSTPTTWSSTRQLRGKQAMYSYSATGSTVTITFADAHKFKVDDVISVDLNVEKPVLFGLDGIYTVASITSTTLTYTLSTALDVPINTKVVTDTLYVYPMAHKYVREGATWADSANNKTWYWDGLRWIDYSSVADPVRDGDPPAAPTGFSATSEGIVAGANSILPLSKITLSWTAPTLTKAGKALDDLVGYTISWRKTTNEAWKSKVIKEQSTSYTFDSDVLFEQNQKYYFKITAFDSGLQDSDPAITDITTSVKATTLTSVAPSAPILTSRLGVVTVKWDGALATTPITQPPSDTAYLQVHYSTTSAFTPSDSTLKDTLTARANNFSQFTDLTYGVTYYFKFILRDVSGQSSLASAQASTQVTPLVNTDIIGKVISGAKIIDGTITASDSIIGNTITGGLIQALAITSGKIDTNAVTADKINAGAITAEKISTGAITAGKILVTDTFSYTNGGAGSSEETVRIGSNAITSISGTPGLAVTLGGSPVGWVGGWGGGSLEVGSSFSSCYIDFYSNNNIYMYGSSVYINSSSSMGISAGNLLSLGGTGVELNGGSGGVSISSLSNFHSRGPSFFDGATVGTGYAVNISTTQFKLQYATSSARYKTNIESIPVGGALDRILALRPVTFTYKPEFSDEPDKIIAGFIAEEVEKIDKLDLVSIYNESGVVESVSYEKFVVFITLAIQELAQKMQELSTINQKEA